MCVVLWALRGGRRASAHGITFCPRGSARVSRRPGKLHSHLAAGMHDGSVAVLQLRASSQSDSSVAALQWSINDLQQQACVAAACSCSVAVEQPHARMRSHAGLTLHVKRLTSLAPSMRNKNSGYENGIAKWRCECFGTSTGRSLGGARAPCQSSITDMEPSDALPPGARGLRETHTGQHTHKYGT